MHLKRIRINSSLTKAVKLAILRNRRAVKNRGNNGMVSRSTRKQSLAIVFYVIIRLITIGMASLRSRNAIVYMVPKVTIDENQSRLVSARIVKQS